MDVVHPLRLDPGRSGREVDGYSGYFDVDMDRNTVFLPGQPGIEYDEVPTMAQIEKEEAVAAGAVAPVPKQITAEEQIREDSDPDTIRVADLRDLIKVGPVVPSGSTTRPSLSNRSSYSDDSAIERVSNMEEDEVREIVDILEPFRDPLEFVAKKYPFISDSGHLESGEKLPYSVALSNQHFLSWTPGRQKSVEWHRARLIQADILAMIAEGLRGTAAEVLTVKAIILWCRQNNFGPPMGVDSGDALQYCRFCGMLEESSPMNGRKKALSLGVEAYCRCGKEIKEQLAVMKTTSTVKEIIVQNRNRSQYNGPSSDEPLLTTTQLRELLSETDANLMRWIWSTMLQLELPGTHSHHTEEITQVTDEEPLAATAVITQATKLFLARLITLASQQTTTTDAEDEDEVIIVGTTSKVEKITAPLVITPIHILRAIRAGREFDFLTNAGMATGSSQTGAGV